MVFQIVLKFLLLLQLPCCFPDSLYLLKLWTSWKFSSDLVSLSSSDALSSSDSFSSLQNFVNRLYHSTCECCCCWLFGMFMIQSNRTPWFQIACSLSNSLLLPIDPGVRVYSWFFGNVFVSYDKTSSFMFYYFRCGWFCPNFVSR